MSAAPSGESTQHFNAYTARVSHKDQTSTQVLCESMDPSVKKRRLQVQARLEVW